MSELTVVTARIDALTKGWAEQFSVLQREISQDRREIRDLTEKYEELRLEQAKEAERAKQRRAKNTRVWVAVVVAVGTIANGALQTVGSSNRASLRAEILDEVARRQSDRDLRLIKMALTEHERDLGLTVKGREK